MLDEKSADYFRHRKQAELKAAKSAGSEAARRVHRELARSYARLLNTASAEAGPRRSPQ
jgi:hypothetical protein